MWHMLSAMPLTPAARSANSSLRDVITLASRFPSAISLSCLLVLFIVPLIPLENAIAISPAIIAETITSIIVRSLISEACSVSTLSGTSAHIVAPLPLSTEYIKRYFSPLYFTYFCPESSPESAMSL